jgi:Spy/CpxP family protein refolding chaperone
MKRLSSVLSAVILSSLLFSASAMAWGGGHARGCNPDCDRSCAQEHIERMAVILDLNSEQQEQIAEMRAAHQKECARMHSELREARQQLHTLQRGADFDAEDLKARARTYADLKAAMLADKIEHKQQMFNILTPEQQEKAAKLAELKNDCNKCVGCEYKGKAGCCANADCCAGKCPKSVAKGKGCCPQGQKAQMDCGKQTSCMMSRCR